MINIGDEPKSAYLSGQYKKALWLSFLTSGFQLQEESIYTESLVIEQGIFDGNDELQFGGCISSKMTIDVSLANGQISRGELVTLEMAINDGDISDSGLMTLFYGYVDSIETVTENKQQRLTCYDALYLWQNKNFYDTYANLTFPCTLGDMRAAIVGFMGLTEAETYDLMVDDIEVDQQITSGEINALDALKQLCEINGVFARINGGGYLEYVRPTLGSPFLPYPSNSLFPSADLYPGTESGNNTVYVDAYSQLVFEDYEVKPIDSVLIRDSAADSQAGSYYADTENTLLIEGNMWMMGLYSIYKTAVAQTFYNELKYITYRPFKSVNRGVPWLECGDAIVHYAYTYTDGEPSTDIMVFMVLHRVLKGVQWLQDEFSASGSEYQPEIKFSSADTDSQLAANVAELTERVSDAETEIGGKENLIEVSQSVPAAGEGEEGDIRLVGDYVESTDTTGAGVDIYRHDGTDWRFFAVATFTQGDMVPLYDHLETGRIVLVYE